MTQIPDEIKKQIEEHANGRFAQKNFSISKAFFIKGAEYGYQLAASLASQEWVSESGLPPVNKYDLWDEEHEISERVLVFVKGFGWRFGKYHYDKHAKFWIIEGIHGTTFDQIIEWRPLPPSPNQSKIQSQEK